MRRHAVVIATVLFTSIAVGLTGGSSQQGKPTEVHIGNTYFVAPPPSLSEMVLASDAVVFGRILGGTSRDGGFRRKNEPGITSFYRLRVSEVLQSFGPRFVDPSELTIVRDGGAIDRGKKVEKLEIADFPQLEPGHEYVLFLRWHDEYEAWTPAWGPNGTFEVKAGRIHSVGSVEVAKKQDGLTVDQFLTKLRRSS